MKNKLFLNPWPVWQRYAALLAFCLVSIWLPTACNNLANEDVSPDYSGEQLFRGLMLNQGPVAGRVPTITNQMPKIEEMVQEAKQFQAVRQIQDHLIARAVAIGAIALGKRKVVAYPLV